MSIVTAEMRQLAKDADYHFDKRAPAVLLPYQQAWLGDQSQVKVVEKSRRIGLSWAEACDAALCAAAANGMDVWYIGYTKDMAIEFILDCAQWAEHFQSVAEAIEVEEDVFIDGDDKKSVFAFSIRFASGNRVTALSSTPRNLRGKQGRVILDESAFHQSQAEILKAAMALLIWGGSLRVISTHNGDLNPFNELIRDIRAGKVPYSLHRITFNDALQQGLFKRISLRTGQEWSPAVEEAWAAGIRAFYNDDADEELDCVPKNGSGTWLGRVLIESCMSLAWPVLRWTQTPEFTYVPTWRRHGEATDWCDEHLKPLLEKLLSNLQSGMGSDVARVGDLSVFFPLVELQRLLKVAPFLVELRAMPFDVQRLIMFYIMDRLPGLRHTAVDARGLGAQMAEEAAQQYGQDQVSQVMLSERWYMENMPPYKAAFEDRSIELPQDADVLNDHRAVKVVKGVARIPDLRTQDVEKKKRHGDSAVAGALAWYAIRQEGGPVVITSRPRRGHLGLGGY